MVGATGAELNGGSVWQGAAEGVFWGAVTFVASYGAYKAYGNYQQSMSDLKRATVQLKTDQKPSLVQCKVNF